MEQDRTVVGVEWGTSYVDPPGGVCVRQPPQVQAPLHVQLVPPDGHRAGLGTVYSQSERAAADLSTHLKQVQR